ncbi:MAG: DUF2256 domain-containing protein [Aureliella sp.]
MAHRKTDLPSKTCKQCGKDFVWRKKWRNCWDDVVYCSERCRRESRSQGGPKKPS